MKAATNLSNSLHQQERWTEGDKERRLRGQANEESSVGGEEEKEVIQKRKKDERERWIMRTDRAEYFTAGIFHTSHNISFPPSDSWV